MTAAEASRRALEIFSASGVEPVHDTPTLDVSLILAHFLGLSRTTLLAHPETALGSAEESFFEAIKRRAAGIPVAYITGTKEFWGLPFHVTPAVLIPKPDTELLVERAIAIIGMLEKTCSLRTDGAPITDGEPCPADRIRVLDVCTGSGCVAVSLKSSCPDISITATDISEAALSVARGNAAALLFARDAAPSACLATSVCVAPSPGVAPSAATPAITFIQGDLKDGLPLPSEISDSPARRTLYDLVVSNPPYVPSAVTRELLADGRGEPAIALDGGTDGLDLVRALVDNAITVLRPGGFLLVETGEYNAREAADYLRKKGFRDVVILRDLGQHERVVEGILA